MLIRTLFSSALSFGIFTLISYKLAKKTRPYLNEEKNKKRWDKGTKDLVDEASDLSFPASDPPAY